jgi:hypothetical protein
MGWLVGYRHNLIRLWTGKLVAWNTRGNRESNVNDIDPGSSPNSERTDKKVFAVLKEMWIPAEIECGGCTTNVYHIADATERDQLLYMRNEAQSREAGDRRASPEEFEQYRRLVLLFGLLVHNEIHGSTNRRAQPARSSTGTCIVGLAGVRPRIRGFSRVL